MLNSHKFVAMRCYPQARFWPKDLDAEGQLDSRVAMLCAEDALRMTMGQQA